MDVLLGHFQEAQIKQVPHRGVYVASSVEEEVDVRQVLVRHVLVLLLLEDGVHFSVALVIESGDFFRDF